MSVPRSSTAAFCVDAREAVDLVPFKQAIKILGIGRQAAERRLRARDPRLPPVLYLDGRRHFRQAHLDEAVRRQRLLGAAYN